jgi:CheY-like chemotaxis protein
LRDSVWKRGYEAVIVASLDDLPPEGIVAAVIDLGDPRTNGRRLLESVVARESRIDIPIIVAALDPPEFFGSSAEMVAAWIRMPFADAALGSALAATVGKPAVLIVEDDVDLARVIAASLERHGLRTIHAATGAKAIEACRIEVPALVILDVILPELDGFAVIQWMRDRGLAHVPVLVYSASDVDALDQDRLRLDRTEFLTKSRAPLNELADRVLDFMRSGRTSPMETTHAA